MPFEWPSMIEPAMNETVSTCAREGTKATTQQCREQVFFSNFSLTKQKCVPRASLAK
jgi:hypothetical protein